MKTPGVRYTGLVALFNEHGICLSARRYGSKAQRQYFINGWQLLFKRGIRNYSIHITPDINENDGNDNLHSPKRKGSSVPA